MRGYEGTVRNDSAAVTEARAAAAADAAFGVDMYQVLAEDAADTVFSPASVASALRMALCGARGKTAAELARALHLDGADRPDDWRSARCVQCQPGGRRVRQRARRGSAMFRAPNTVWVQSGLPLRAEFTARLSQAAAMLAERRFRRGARGGPDPDQPRDRRADRGQDHRIAAAGAVTRLTRLVLASAVYLKAAWTHPFGENETADAPFYPDGQDRPGLTVPMMHLTAPQAYLRGDGYQAVLLPYRDVGLAMAVVLPDGPLSALRPKVTAAGLGGLLAGTARHQVTLSLPRFRLEAAFDLIPALRRLGVTEAFGDEADFGGITEAEPLRIGAVAHKAYIDVDEHGTEAAAATAVVMAGMAAFRAPAAGHDGRGPAVPVRDPRHRDQPVFPARSACRSGSWPYPGADPAPAQPGAGMERRQPAGQVLPGGRQAVRPELGQAVEDEHGAGGGVGDPGADALPPVPATAGHAVVIAPDHLARLGVFGHRLSVAHGVERLVPGRAGQPGRAAVPGQVLAAGRQQVADRDRVVDVGEPVDPGQPGLHPAQQRLDAGPGALRLGAEGLVGEPPGGHRRELLGRPEPPSAARAFASASLSSASVASSPGPGRSPSATMTSAV